MNKLLAVIALACLASHAAAAPQTYDKCMRACAEVGPSPAKKARFTENMAALSDRKSRENDPHKREQLKEEEISLIEKHQDDTERMCRHICEGMPEQ